MEDTQATPEPIPQQEAVPDQVTTQHDEAQASAPAELHIDEITSHDVAARLQSFAAAVGPQEATAALQRALATTSPTILDDGVLSPKTLAAINAADPAQLIERMRAFERQFYIHRATVNPALLPELAGLLNRADA